MDHLILAVKNLTAKEKAALQKKIAQQKQKLKLFQIIEEKKTADNKILSEELDYGTNVTGLYTLKNRLFDDIVDVKLEIKKNPLVVIKEKVQNLRNLVYDKDKVSLLREIKRMEKYTESYELFDEQKEVYFCLLLTFRHDQRKAMQYKKLMDACAYKQMLTDKLEQIFYLHLLDAPQDMFYSSRESTRNATHAYLKELEALYEKLETKASYFLYKSAYLTINLNSVSSIDNPEQMEEELNELLNVYSNSFLPYKYPHCHIAIQCLFSKFYMLTGNKKKFLEVQNYINSHLDEVEGYQMFDCSYYYYLYVSVVYYLDEGDTYKIIEMLNRYVEEEEVEYKSDKMKVYFWYLVAVKYYYAREYDKCFTALMKARNFFSSATATTVWICRENILLSILVNIELNDINFILSEIDLLKRILKKFDMEDIYQAPLLALQKAIKNYEADGNYEKLMEVLNAMKTGLSVFRLIQWNDREPVPAY
jgi:hypothetical protein